MATATITRQLFIDVGAGVLADANPYHVMLRRFSAEGPYDRVEHLLQSTGRRNRWSK